MLSLNLSDLKKQTAQELQATIDRALSAMLYPQDDLDYVDGDTQMLRIVDDLGTTALGGAANIVALRYLWLLYKKATIPNYVPAHSPAWYTSDKGKLL